MRYHGCKGTETQAIYNRCYVESSVYAYIKLKNYADDDASIHMSRVQEVQRMVNVNVLRTANQLLVAEERVQELEEGDGRQSPVISDEESTAVSVEGFDEGPEVNDGAQDEEPMDQDPQAGYRSETDDEEMEPS